MTGDRVLSEYAGGPARTPVRGRGAWARFLAGFAVLYGVLAVTGAADRTGRWGLLLLAVVLAGAAVVERVLHGAAVLGAPRRLGLGDPGRRSPVLALGIAALVLLAHPLSAAVTGAPVELRTGWLWLLIGTFAFHGVAEEVVSRGLRRGTGGHRRRSTAGLPVPRRAQLRRHPGMGPRCRAAGLAHRPGPHGRPQLAPCDGHVAGVRVVRRGDLPPPRVTAGRGPVIRWPRE